VFRLALLTTLAVVVALGGRSAAQGTTGTITGFVTDPSNAAVPGATVTIRAVETDQTRVLVTDGDGRYRAPALSPGRYEVVVELAGFQTARHQDLSLSVGQDVVVNVQLKVGALDESVVVTGQSSLVETRQSSVAALVDEQQIRELPLNGRDFSQLTLLQPGVVASPTTARQVDRGMGTQVSIAGSRPNQISYQLDGTDINTQGNGSPGSAAGGQLGVETVREFQVLVNNYSAEYGRSSGGIVTAVTRSGTNTLRGTAFEFLRDSTFDSKNFFDPEDAEIPPLERHQFGGYLGGPIKQDQTFFFGSYEGLRQDRGTTSLVRVPSNATHNRTDVHPAVRPYLNLYPRPNAGETGSTGLYSIELVEPTTENYLVGKVDHTLSQNHSVSVRYTWDKADVTTPNSLNLFSLQTATKNQFLVGEYKWVMSSTLLNVAKVAWNRAFEETISLDNVDLDPALFFIPGTQFGSISISGGLQGLGPDTNTPTYIDLKSLQIVNNLTWARGSHNVKTGIAFTRWFNDQDSSFVIGGNYGFTSLDNFLLNRPGTYEGQAPGSSTYRQWRQNLIGLYLQDEWSVTRNLTLNTGLRYEFITTPTEKNGRMAALPDLQGSSTIVTDKIFENPSLKNFAPRLGFAWDISGDGKNALHGGAGYFFEPILGNVYRAYGNRTPPFYALINPSNPTFPNPPLDGALAELRLDLVEYDLENPYRIQYNLTYQREILPQTVVTAGYVGARGFQQIRNIEYNQSIGIEQPDGRYFFPTSPTGGNPPRRNPAFGTMRLRISDGESWYNGLIVGGTRRFSQGLALQASYTLGKSTDLGSQAVGSGDFDNSFQPAYGHDPETNKGLSDFDVRHNFVFNYTWELPFGQDLTGAAGAIADGWQLSGIVTLRSGIPFSPVLGFDRARARPRSGGAGQRPDLVAGCDENPVLGGTEMYFDVNCFELPEAGFLSLLPRNSIIGPGYASWDMAVFKNFRFSDRTRLQIRVEAFNILNRANFDLPAATVFNAAGRVPGAGEITDTAGPARQWQFGIKFEF
jgi:hypothetical protein